MSENTENIKVFVRVRPSSHFERIVQVLSEREIALLSNGSFDSKYKFSAIFSEDVHQDVAYNEILLPIVREFIHGFNCTLFSYGATRNDASNINSNVGSSTPMPPSGQNKCPSVEAAAAAPPPPPTATTDDTMPILVSCAMHRLFVLLNELELSSSVRISYLEILDEELFDLLQPRNGTQLKIFENDKNQVFVNGLSETTVHSAAEAIMIFRMAQKNAHSLKSHSIFTVSMQTKETPKFQLQENEGLFKFRKLCLVQLGNQEHLKKHARAKNVQSLTSLSRVVQALTNKQSHIPYRDSKLTRIMQESLGGNAKTSIVASIGSTINCMEETCQALEFLNRMKGICNHPKVNERLDDSRTLNEMSSEIRKLMMDIEANRNKTGHFLTDEMYVNYQKEMETTRMDSRRHRQELKSINEARIDLDSTFSNVNSSLCVKKEALAQRQSETFNKQKQLQTISNVNEKREILIDRHASTEKTLFGQANELTSTVEMVIDDKGKLDDCVSRYKSTDERLIQTVQDFHTDMQERLSNLKRNSTIVLAMIDGKLQKTGELEKNMMRCATSLIEVVRKRSFRLLDQLEKSHVNESKKWSNIKNEFDKVLQGRLKSIDFNCMLYKEYARAFEEKSNKIETSYQEIRKLYENYFIDEDKLITDIKQRMTMHANDVSEQLKSLQLTVEECAEIGKIIDEKMNAIYTEMRNIVSKIQQNTADMRNIVEPTLQIAEQNIQQTRHKISESINAYEISVKEQQNMFKPTKLPDNLKTSQNRLKESSKRKMLLTNDSLEKVAANNSSSIGCGRQYVESFSANIPQKCDFINADGQIPPLKYQINENERRAFENDTGNIRVIKDALLTIERMSQENSDEISSCVKHLRNFREKDFSEYRPSGETPSKCDYSTNISLVATTPLEKIKQRFRDRLSQINAASPNLEYSFLNE